MSKDDKPGGNSKRGAQLKAIRRLHLPNVRADKKTISGCALKAVLRSIDDHGEKCWASSVTIGAETCLTERTVRFALKTLKKLGFITIDERVGQTSNIQIQWQRIVGTPETISGVEGESGHGTPEHRTEHPGNYFQSPRNIGTRTPETISDEARRSVKETRKKRESKLRFDADDFVFSQEMLSKIKEVAPKTKPPNLEEWSNCIRLMRENDGYTLDEIREVFDFANQDGFWRANILSPGKLRKHISSLHAQMQRPMGKGKLVNQSSGVNFTPGRECKWQ